MELNDRYEARKEEMFAILGRIVWQCAWIESGLRSIIAVQEGITEPVEAAKKFGNYSGKDLIIRAADFISTQGDETAKNDAQYLRSISWIFDDRNDYVHGIHWVGLNWSRLRVKKQPPYVSESEVSFEQMKAFYKSLDEISDEIAAMRFFRGLLPDGFGFQNY